MNKYSIATNIISLIFLFVPFVLPDVLGLGEDRSFLFGVMIGIFGFYFLSHLALLIEMGVFKDEVKKQIASGYKVADRGLPKLLQKQIARDILSANHVRNTFVGVSADNVANVYADWLRNPENGVWQDIVGMPEFFSDRFRDIGIFGQQEAEHKIYVLKEFSHIINFIILSFPDENRRDMVYFGWIANDHTGASKIFSSSDKAVVQMFSNQFENLKKITWNEEKDVLAAFKGGFDADYTMPIPERDSIGPPSLVDKSGVWETVSYHKDENGDEVIGSFAVIQIDFDYYNVLVDAHVFDTRGNKSEDFTVDYEATYSLNNIFFVYKLKESNQTGLCHYKFNMHSSGKKMLKGVFCDSEFQKRNTVVGFYREQEIPLAEYSPNFVVQRLKILEEEIERLDETGTFKDGPELGLVATHNNV